jgi:hypothetical protein
MEHEPQNLERWQFWQCNNPKFNYEEDFTPAHAKAPSLCINCPVWENKNQENK